MQDGRDEFFVKWVGWGSQFNTWEPLHYLNCSENLNIYMKKLIVDILFVKWLEYSLLMPAIPSASMQDAVYRLEEKKYS